MYRSREGLAVNKLEFIHPLVLFIFAVCFNGLSLGLLASAVEQAVEQKNA